MSLLFRSFFVFLFFIFKIRCFGQTPGQFDFWNLNITSEIISDQITSKQDSLIKELNVKKAETKRYLISFDKLGKPNYKIIKPRKKVGKASKTRKVYFKYYNNGLLKSAVWKRNISHEDNRYFFYIYNSNKVVVQEQDLKKIKENFCWYAKIVDTSFHKLYTLGFDCTDTLKTYVHNDINKVITIYSNDGKVVSIKYDSLNRITEEKMSSSILMSGHDNFTHKCYYNDKLELSEIIGSEGTLDYTIEYLSNGLIDKITYDRKTSDQSKHESKYNYTYW
jgi:hypothetical protein